MPGGPMNRSLLGKGDGPHRCYG